MAPRKNDNKDFNVARHVLPSCQLPPIDIASDTGKFVAAILAEPDKCEGQRLCAATRLYSISEIVDIMAKKSGKTVKYVQLPNVNFQAVLSSSVGKYADALIEMMLFQQDFGYYWLKTKELVQWAAENARGQLTGFEEYLNTHPIAALQ